MRKIHITIISAILITCLLFPVSAWGVPYTDEEDAASDLNKDTVSILFSHDMHSHLDAETITLRSGSSISEGGFAKMKTVIDEVKTEYPDTLLIDGGDFSMGTSYQTIFESHASEIVMMGKLGYDATTIGNHELDYGASGLADMLDSAVDNQEEEESSWGWEQYQYQQTMGEDEEALPSILCANVDWDKVLKSKKTAKAGKELKKAFEEYGVEDYKIIEKNGVKIAVFGIMGPESASFAPESGLYFTDYIERSREVVDEIKRNDEADLIICLSHSGTKEDSDDSEDQLLAEAVPDIDIIISGHTHTELSQPIMEGDTIIASCGQYTENLGQILLKKKGGKYELESYELLKLGNSVEPDYEIEQELTTYKELADEEYFSDYDGYTTDSVIAENDVDFIDIDELETKQGEEPLADLITDSYVYAVKNAEGSDYEKVDVAFTNAGLIRGSLNLGEVTINDVFKISSLGMGKDGKPGYPLVSMYLTGKELKTLAEIDASISPKMPEAKLYMSGLSYHYNPHRLIFNRATDIKLDLGDGKYEEIDNDKTYRVVVSLYLCQMMDLVGDKSFGLLSVKPKDKKGNEIANFEDHIVYEGDEEIKEWYALAKYIDSFSDSEIPSYYEETHGRKILDDTRNIGALIKQPNNFAFMVLGIILIPIVIIVGIIIFIRRKMGGGRRKQKNIFSQKKKRFGRKRRKNKRYY